MCDELFPEAYPLIRRAAQVRAAALRALRAEWVDPEDFEQECALAAWLKLRRFDPRRASLATFIERVIATKCASLARKERARKRTRLDPDTPANGSPHAMVNFDLSLDIKRAIERLSRADQNVARLLLLAHKPAEIARRIRCSRAAVYRTMDRIRSALEASGLGKSSS